MSSNMPEAVITDISVEHDTLIIRFRASEETEAWLENSNKHCPDILYITADNANGYISVGHSDILGFLGRFPGQTFKLSMCTDTSRVKYTVSEKVKTSRILDVNICTDNDSIVLYADGKARAENPIAEECCEICHSNRDGFEDISEFPISTLNIGTCFSRSIFKSDEYFNPDYKKYFTIGKTLFHNSLISLFSQAVAYDYSATDDLTSGDAAKYVGIEFDKNISEIIRNNSFRLVVVDNYMDATTPVIRYGRDSYLTYNKYLSESIFKRFFSSCEVIYPGSAEHSRLYRESVISFRNIMEKYNIKNIVLMGGRLSKYKTDEFSGETSEWTEKMNWILNSNNNWNTADRIFLEVIPEAFYINKTHTSWKSDIHSPIIGGASPSHYQSGYYKELFSDLLKLTGRNLTDE